MAHYGDADLPLVLSPRLPLVLEQTLKVSRGTTVRCRADVAHYVDLLLIVVRQ
jgi:hypothetical protein